MTGPRPSEPILSAEDHYLWEEVWTPAFLDHAESRSFRRHLEQAKQIVNQALDRPGRALVCVSGGKDSTALGELIAGELGHRPENKEDRAVQAAQALVRALLPRRRGDR